MCIIIRGVLFFCLGAAMTYDHHVHGTTASMSERFVFPFGLGESAHCTLHSMSDGGLMYMRCPTVSVFCGDEVAFAFGTFM